MKLSRLLPPYLRRTKSVEELIPWLYLKGVSTGDFQEALSLRSLPIPDYTSSEIMAEEAANQQKRARRKAVRAGAKVEKNW